MKPLKLILVAIILIFAAVFAAACADVDSEGSDVYSVIFDLNGGLGSNLKVFTNGRQGIVMPAEPVRPGYIFDGWYFDVGIYDREFVSDTLIAHPIDRNITVFAKWESNAVLPSTPGNGGGSGEPELPIYTVNFYSKNGDIIETNASNVRGYLTSDNIFPYQNYTNGRQQAGWYLTENFEGDPITLPYKLTGNITIYLKWISLQYKITFSGGDGATGNPPFISDKAQNETFRLPGNSFTRENKAFSFWMDDSGRTYAPGDLYPMDRARAVTFTAQWVDTYTAGFYPADGGIGVQFSITGLRAGDPFVLPDCPFTKDKARFTGWVLRSSPSVVRRKGLTEYMVVGGLIYYSAWEDVYNVLFDGGGGIGEAPYVPDMGARVQLRRSGKSVYSRGL
jgi:Listeria/Bacterioides repeat